MSTPAQRAKTLLATTSCVEVGVLDHRTLLRRHALEGGGAVLFSLTEVSPRCVSRLGDGDVGPELDLVAVDVSGIPGPDRVRGRVRLSGTATVVDGPVREDLRRHLELPDDGRVGRLVPDRLDLEWTVETGGTPAHHVILPAEYTAARVDALGGWAEGWLAHLASDHDELLRHLAARHVRLDEDARVRPVLADELGLVLRADTGGATRDVRIPFARRALCGCEAVRALNELTGSTAPEARFGGSC